MSQEIYSRRKFLQVLAGFPAAILASSPECLFLYPNFAQNNPELPPELKEKFFEDFLKDYQIFKDNFVLDAGSGAKRVVHNPEVNDSSLEMQALGEIFAHFANDEETFAALATFDRRYIDENGLAPWYMNPDGSVGDETVVSNVMMTLAWIRLQKPEYKEEGLKILDGIKKHLINNDTNIPTAFHWPDSKDLINPAYLNLFFMEEFSQHDPYWQTVIESTMHIFDYIGEKIDKGEIASFPTWVDMQGNPIEVADTGVALMINYDITYTTLQMAQEALCGENEKAVENAVRQLSRLNNFFYHKICIFDENGTVVGYDIDKLQDGYNLDGSVNQDEPRYSRTAWASAAFVASQVSEDENYRSYMMEHFSFLPVDYSFNQYMHTYANLTMSGEMKTKE